MSEITKLYENAGIEYEERYNNCTLNKEGDCELKCSCDICKYSEERYIFPLLTAEKQIELIKWIAKTRPIHITFLIDKWVIEGMVRYGKRYDTFEDALSGYINSIWKDLSEEERQQCSMNGDFENLKAKTQCYCWVIWEKGYKGETVLRWI